MGREPIPCGNRRLVSSLPFNRSRSNELNAQANAFCLVPVYVLICDRALIDMAEQPEVNGIRVAKLKGSSARFSGRDALLSPSNVAPLADPEPADTRAIPRSHLSDPQKLAIGRWLLHTKASMQHGHFGPWVERQEGLS
jgi:hypothetical protein